MEKSFAMRSFVSLTLALFLGFMVTVAASADLSFLPPLDHVQASTVDSASSHTPGSRTMSRLIRIHFGDQARWRPFLRHDEQRIAHHAHHRVVREYRPRPSVQSTQPTSEKVDCGMRLKPGHDLAAQQYHLRGHNPALVPHPQTVVEVTGQHDSVELASQL